ncbi:MAG: ATP-binding cassette domain-containing protein [Planctomycetota bacterium]
MEASGWAAGTAKSSVVGPQEVSFEPGITGLLGPNGAGKSTFMRLVVGELKPSRGSLRVLGHVPFANRELYPRLGFAPQQDALYDEMSGLGFVRHLLRLSGYSRSEATRLATRAMERVDCRRDAPALQGLLEACDGAHLAQAIAHDPICSCSTSLTGLDPVARRRAIDLFRELADEGPKPGALFTRAARGGIGHGQHRSAAPGTAPGPGHGGGHPPRTLAPSPRTAGGGRSATPTRRGPARIEAVRRVEVHDDHPLRAHPRPTGRPVRRPSPGRRTHQPGIRSLQSSDADLESVFDFLVQ